jgi:hypothetical protein
MSRLDRLTVLGSGMLGSQIAFHSAFKAAKQCLPFTTKLATAR